LLAIVAFTGGATFGALPPAANAGASTISIGDFAAMCGTFRVIPLRDGRALCTHGPDPASEIAPGHSRGLIFDDPPGGAPSQAAATPGIGCYGNGQDGNRVEALYAFPAGGPDRFRELVPSIRQWAAETDAVFQSSAAQTGGTRRIRFVTDPNCDLVVTRVALSANGDNSLDTTIAELAARGYNRSDRKYLVWMDSTVYCGIATYYADSRKTADNLNNGRSGIPGSVARIDSGCWGLGSRGQSVEAHELMHTLGAVIPTAPNSTVNGHCDDDDDRMCYSDGSPLLVLQDICPSQQEALFDCRHDDYFHTAPPAGSYLASNWNAANSSFLETSFESPTLSVADGVATEGNSDGSQLSFEVTLSAPNPRPVTTSFSTSDGSASAPADYQTTTGVLIFNPGERAKTVSVAIKPDQLNEANETFSLQLSSPSNATLGRPQAFGTIIDREQSSSQGYWFVAADGGIFTFGEARFYGSTGNVKLNQPIVGMAATPSGKGYWLVARDGGIFTFGDANFYGSTGSVKLNQPIVGMAATPSGKGYWFVAADGGIFTFGDAGFHGAAANPSEPIVGIAVTPSGNGYWCVGRDGQVYAFGDARHAGAPAAQVGAVVSSRSGRGYWVAETNGAVHAFGDARSFGGTGDLAQPVVGMAVSPKGGGYWLVARDGGIFAFGDARFYGSTGNIRLNQPIVGMTATSTL
jgi:hypothetical protein